MMPSKYRGRVDIWINGSYWAGAILGSFASLIFLNAFAPNVGWRLAFLMGPVLALVVLVARTLPESPRWLLTHGRVAEAEDELAKIEEMARRSGEPLAGVGEDAAISDDHQSFLYNAIFFTYALVLTSFYGVDAIKVPIYGLAFSVGNLAGPLLLGRCSTRWAARR